MEAHPEAVPDDKQAAETARPGDRIAALETQVQALTAEQAKRAVEDGRLRAVSAQRAAEARKGAEAMRARAGVAEAALAASRAEPSPADTLLRIERERLLADLSLVREERDSLLASTSWRVTRPLRGAIGLLRRRLRQPPE